MQKLLIHGLIFLVFLSGCQNNTERSKCGGTSIRLLSSYCNEKFDDIINSIDATSHPILIEMLKSHNEIRYDLTILLGGFETGKSLEIPNDCTLTKDIIPSSKIIEIQNLSEDILVYLLENQLIDNEFQENIKFILDSYFELNKGVFSQENMEMSTSGYLVLESHVFYFTFYDLVYLSLSGSISNSP